MHSELSKRIIEGGGRVKDRERARVRVRVRVNVNVSRVCT